MNRQPMEVSNISWERSKAALDLLSTYGARLMDSTPPAMKTSP